MNKKTHKRDGNSTSVWESAFAALTSNQKISDIYDVVIVGAGITGISTALELQNRGLNCLVTEANDIGSGTTGGTSAHLNTFLDATYPEIESDFGKQAAVLIAKASKEAIAIIKQNVSTYQISADLEERIAYLYAEDEQQDKMLQDIFEASKRVKVKVKKATDAPFPMAYTSALIFDEQAQFHPIKYLNGLVKALLEKGGQILEQSPFLESKFEEGQHFIKLSNHLVKAKHLVYATHTPPGINLLNFRCAPYRSYVVAATLKGTTYPDSLWYDMQEPYHYWRTHVIDGQPYLLVGGEDHKTGQGNPEEALENLKTYVKQYYKVEDFPFEWSSQYYVPVDGLPYIGQMPMSNESTWIATGYNGNGMIWGTMSAKILADLITEQKNEYAELLSPSRLKPVAGFTEFVKENANVAWHFIADRFTAEQIDEVDAMEPLTGKVIDTSSGKIAVHKTKSGKVKAISAVCTHAGCIVNFNPLEQTWDCPCHGGRYNTEGKVLTGPPLKNLDSVNWGELK